MDKFLSMHFAGVVMLAFIVFVVHELGHYLAYRILGYQATIRKSLLAPGIDPKETIEIPCWQGLFIALSGFIFSTGIVVFPLFLMHYTYWFVLLIGSVAGSCVDAMWAISMIGRKKVTIYARK